MASPIIKKGKDMKAKELIRMCCECQLRLEVMKTTAQYVLEEDISEEVMRKRVRTEMKEIVDNFNKFLRAK